MKINKQIIIFGLSFAITACTSITVIPEGGGRQTVIANASTSEKAIELAIYKAGRICNLKAKSLKIVEMDTTYQGEDKEQQKLINQARTILPRRKTSGPYTPSDYLYKGTLTFKCIR